VDHEERGDIVGEDRYVGQEGRGDIRKEEVTFWRRLLVGQEGCGDIFE
jgi:hypothetical protein